MPTQSDGRLLTPSSNRCPLCNEVRSTLRRATPQYDLRQCDACGMIWDPEPRPDPVAIYHRGYYEGDYPRGGYRNYIQGMEVNRRTFRQRLMKAAQKSDGKKGALLDVGCALGDCLIQAQELGWKHPQGLEVSAYAAETARSRGLDVVHGNLLHNPFKPGTFDLVLLQDVLEHTLEPSLLIKAIYQLLKPGGLLLVTTPNIGGILARAMGRFWYHYKPGEHLTYFSIPTIRQALQGQGFNDVAAVMSTNTMSLEYVLNRLELYQPAVFKALARLARRMGCETVAFNLPIGELEAWARKPI